MVMARMIPAPHRSTLGESRRRTGARLSEGWRSICRCFLLGAHPIQLQHVVRRTPRCGIRRSERRGRRCWDFERMWNVHIRRSTQASPDAARLIAALNAEPTATFPEPCATQARNSGRSKFCDMARWTWLVECPLTCERELLLKPSGSTDVQRPTLLAVER